MLCETPIVYKVKLIYYPLIDKAYSSLLRMPRLSVPLLVGEVQSAYYLSEAVEGSPTAQGNEFSLLDNILLANMADSFQNRFLLSSSL